MENVCKLDEALSKYYGAPTQNNQSKIRIEFYQKILDLKKNTQHCKQAHFNKCKRKTSRFWSAAASPKWF
jgi:hypothetical protein